ncbi:hypothetical protein ME786_14350 [Lactobacillus delbrueckii]|nr:hypothetical protein ME786_14350 [Lactobacillus delbrueckii]
MKTEVYLVRHGETLFNRLNKVQGWCDTPLTIKGIDDLKKTAAALSQIHFDNMYSSDLKRAIDTVHLMKDANQVSKIGKIKKLPEFREIFYGSFEGGSIDDIWLSVSKAAGIPATTDVKKIIDTIGIYKFREVTKKADPPPFGRKHGRTGNQNVPGHQGLEKRDQRRRPGLAGFPRGLYQDPGDQVLEGKRRPA